MRIILRFVFILLPLCLLALSMAARAAAPGGDLYFGYSRLGANAFNANTPGLNGWEAEGQVKFIPFVGIDADVARYGLGAVSTVSRTTTVMVGPRVTVGAAGIHVFAHGLAGWEHSANNPPLPVVPVGSGQGSATSVSSGGLTVDAGAGVDFRLVPMFAWRVSADYIDAPNQSPSSADRYRFGTGLVFRF